MLTGTNLDWLRSHSPPNDAHQLLQQLVTGHLKTSKYALPVRDCELERIIRMAVFPVQRPADGLIKRDESNVVYLGNMTEYAVDGLGLVVFILAFFNFLV